MCYAFGISSLTLNFLIFVVSFSHTNSQYSYLSSALRVKRDSSCGRFQYQCANGECIPSYSVCDGPKDCSDGSDETITACRAVNIRCPSLAFECAYGACIDKELKCNNHSDCADGSDELVCNYTRPATSLGCEKDKFHCNDGQCIDQYGICDGTKDCADGSDETKDLCKNLKCPSSSFQCHYGACLEGTVHCNGQLDCTDGSDELGCPELSMTSSERPASTSNMKTCILPKHPKHGKYTSTLCQNGDQREACQNIAGVFVPNNWLLKYSCNKNYNLTSTDSEYSICENGVWKNPLDCFKLCKPLKSLSLNIRCDFQGHEVTCDNPMKPSTRATPKCKQHYRLLYTPEYSSITCQDNGEWSYPLFQCTPDCGVSTKSDTISPLILNGSQTQQGEFPWLAALYLLNGSKLWEQKCAGTLITPHIVLTAAHCLIISDVAVQPENLKVGLGKHHRNYYLYENNSVIANVKEIVTPRYYSGLATLFALDIGLIDLAESVQITAYIMPACVDWHSTITIQSGELGYVAGWGKTENGISSETVLSAQLEYVDNKECISRVRPIYQRFVTSDKFCASSYNGTEEFNVSAKEEYNKLRSQVNKGDSGGGLTFVRENEQHFVFGVVSTKITQETKISLFTDITNAEHRYWLNDEKTKLDWKHKTT